MPERETIEGAREDSNEGKSPSTQAGEFVREEIHHVREGKHGARSPQQAIAIGLSKARRTGVTSGALKRESKKSATRQAVSGQAKRRSAKRGKRARSAAAMKAAHTRRAA